MADINLSNIKNEELDNAVDKYIN
ncbi:hypothetical protein CHRYSEO8AT_470040 [Chryseobacterium sp. 8AT]|nr:hypothetical protein CHRYSEO8AT_470040 [Chryseobacterium sp. 8AT]